MELGDVGTSGAAGGDSGSIGAAVTALTLAGRNTLFAGHSDGVVRAFRIDSGDLFQTYTPPSRREMAASAFEDAKPDGAGAGAGAGDSGEAKASGEVEEQASLSEIMGTCACVCVCTCVGSQHHPTPRAGLLHNAATTEP